MSDIFEKLNKLRNEFTDEADKTIINQWEDELRELGVRIDVLRIEPIRDYIERLANKVRENKKRLSEDSEVAEKERTMLFAEVKVYNEVLNFFLSAKNYAQYLEKQIDEAYNSLK
jgi:recombinational DNA repair ATPase RecF